MSASSSTSRTLGHASSNHEDCIGKLTRHARNPASCQRVTFDSGRLQRTSQGTRTRRAPPPTAASSPATSHTTAGWLRPSSGCAARRHGPFPTHANGHEVLRPQAIERRLDLVDAQLALASLVALAGPAAKAGADALIELSTRYGLRLAEELVLGWLDRRGLPEFASGVLPAASLFVTRHRSRADPRSRSACQGGTIGRVDPRPRDSRPGDWIREPKLADPRASSCRPQLNT
jgi:hypothetical protein